MRTSKNGSSSALTIPKLYILIILGSTLIALPLISIAVDPILTIFKYVTRISVGSTLYNRIQQENEGARLELYIFNVTNAEAFLSGDDYKLKIEEVGPFNYQEFRANNIIEVDEDEGVIRYVPLVRTEFIEHGSIADPRSINISVPNPSFLSISSMISSYPFWTKGTFNIIASNLHSQAIINLNVHEFLWGYDDPLIAFSHNLLPGWIHFETLGILDRLYDQSASPLLEVSIKNEDKFQVKRMNGHKGINVLGYDDENKRTRCNTFEDTYEGYAFPPGITKDNKIRLYRSVFCRMLDLDFVRTSSTDFSAQVFEYALSNTTYSLIPDNECLCPGKDQCTDGTSTMAPCLYGLGIGLSYAHFLHADPKIYERVEGIQPNLEKHGSRIVIDPRVGAVVSTSFTLQLNVLMQDVRYNYKVKPFANMTVPLAYIKIISDVHENDRRDINAIHNIYPYVIHGLEAITLLTGLAIWAYVVYQMYKKLNLRNSYDMKVTNNNHVNILQETPLIDDKVKTVC